VPSQRASAESADSLNQAVFTSVPSGRTLYYTVRRGDTLPVIAARYGVTAQDVPPLEQSDAEQARPRPAHQDRERRRAGQKRNAKARRQAPAKAVSGKSAKR
jgi:hypothetical protein